MAKLAVVETACGSLGVAHAALTARCGNVIGKRRIEQVVARVAVDAFYAARFPVPCTAFTVLALSVEGKGIAMRPQTLRPAPGCAAALVGGFVWMGGHRGVWSMAWDFL
ncbi:hypothetical protein GCM10022224_026520 [Nonomuraea antimicrobica]|uniref:Uncharacterized protein n=1 Tax=Nonomuraea antimicrobica TaxID=561173 RepID=A0ABP7BK28_9ACTN